jgi:hypothetical protein
MPTADEAQSENSLVRINMDDWTPDQQHTLRSTAAELSNITFFRGHIEHGYSLSTSPNPGVCPRCNAATQQYYGNFIYATDISARVVFAPAGYFCTECPTVIIDEEMIEGAMTRNYRYQGVLGIDYEGEKKLDIFRTWNGKDAIYILDEDGKPEGIATLGSQQEEGMIKRRKSSRRDRMAKQSRKRNRRRR